MLARRLVQLPVHATRVAPPGAAWRALRWPAAARLALTLALGSGLPGASAWAQDAPADQLRARFAAAQARQVGRLLDQPIYLQSTESGSQVQADVHALIGANFAQVRQSLVRADQWCGVLILHLNVQYCRASGPPGQEVLDVGLGRKFDEPLDDLHWLHFSWRVARADDSYLKVVLDAPAGPLGTQDYRLVFEAAPSANAHTLVHLGFGYGHGIAARLAMQAYLATLGRDKVGFSSSGTGSDGRPRLVGGMRGVNERNTMRYYLSIEAYLAVLALPPAQRLAQSLQNWFTATERYPRQLHEVDRPAYLGTKQRQLKRQESEPVPKP